MQPTLGSAARSRLIRWHRLLLTGLCGVRWRERRRKADKREKEQDRKKEIEEGALPVDVHRRAKLGAALRRSSLVARTKSGKGACRAGSDPGFQPDEAVCLTD